MLKNIKSLKILTKKDQKNITGANFNPLESCEAQATVFATIRAQGETLHQVMYEIHYSEIYLACTGGVLPE